MCETLSMCASDGITGELHLGCRIEQGMLIDNANHVPESAPKLHGHSNVGSHRRGE